MNINEIYGHNTKRTIDPAKRAEGIKRVIYFFNTIGDDYRRNHPENKSEQDPQTDKNDIRVGDGDNNTGVRQQRMGQFDTSAPAEANGGRRIEEFVKRVFLRGMPDK